MTILGAGWMSGHLQNASCGLVLENSNLYDRLNCDSFPRNSVVEGEESDEISDFSVKVSDSESTNSSDVSNIFENTSEAVVGIGIESASSLGNQVIGSGFVVSSDGYIATNQHVVSEASEEYFVKFEGSDELVQVEKIYRDDVNDLAVIKIDKSSLSSLTLGDSDKVKPGQGVVAIGNPLGELSSTVTSGIVSAVNREVTIGTGSFLRTDTKLFENTIQTDAAINPGNSGGPLLNMNGHVIGINFATVQGYDNLSFAIPVNLLKQRLKELSEFGKFRIPYLGIQYKSRLVRVGDQVHVGAEVIKVDPESGAAKGLNVGDTIIMFGDVDFESTNLSYAIQKSEIGEEVEVVVVTKAGKKVTRTVTITETKD